MISLWKEDEYQLRSLTRLPPFWFATSRTWRDEKQAFLLSWQNNTYRRYVSSHRRESMGAWNADWLWRRASINKLLFSLTPLTPTSTICCNSKQKQNFFSSISLSVLRLKNLNCKYVVRSLIACIALHKGTHSQTTLLIRWATYTFPQLQPIILSITVYCERIVKGQQKEGDSKHRCGVSERAKQLSALCLLMVWRRDEFVITVFCPFIHIQRVQK